MVSGSRICFFVDSIRSAMNSNSCTRDKHHETYHGGILGTVTFKDKGRDEHNMVESGMWNTVNFRAEYGMKIRWLKDRIQDIFTGHRWYGVKYHCKN